MSTFIMDIEGDGLLDTITKVWCVVFKEYRVDNFYLFTDHVSEWPGLKVFPTEKIEKFIRSKVSTLVTHNMFGFDLEVLRRFYGIPYTVLPDSLAGKKVTLDDSLVRSRYNHPDRELPFKCPTHQEVAGQAKKKPVGPHGLYPWGYRVGVGKPEVLDWSTQPIGVYINRCIEDCKINDMAYTKMIEEIS